MKTNFSPSQARETGLTRLDLVAVLAATGLIALLALPALAADRKGSQLAACFSNLRQLGQAYLTWGAKHKGQRPVRVPAPEGTLQYLKTGNTWKEYLFLREELGSPRVLACPADEGAQAARGWFPPSGELDFPSFSRLRDRAVSYFVGLDTHSGSPRAFLAGDRHMTTFGLSGCSSGINNAQVIRPTSPVQWTNAVHGLVGHILFNDGSVEQLSSRGLREAAGKVPDDNGSFHLLFPNQ